MNTQVLRAFFKEASELQLANVPKKELNSPPAAPQKVLNAGTDKLQALQKKERVEKARDFLGPVDTVRPYAHRALIGAIPGGWLGGWAVQTPGPKHRLVGAALGAGVSLGDKVLENLSKKREYKDVLKSYQEPLQKSASMGSLDLRTATAGLKKTPFATEGSKGPMRKALSKANATFGGTAATPSISQQAVRT